MTEFTLDFIGRKLIEIQEDQRRLFKQYGYVETKLTALDARMQAMEARMQALDAKLDMIIEDMRVLTARIERLVERVERLEQQAGGQQGRFEPA